MKYLILFLSLSLLFISCKEEKEDTPIENTPDYAWRGYNHLNNNRFVEAEKSFQNALEAGQDSSRTYIGLSLLKTRSIPEDSAEYYIANFEAAVPDLTKAIQLDPNNPYGYALRGEARLYSLDYIGAIEDFERLVLIAPKNPGSYFFLGEALFQKGDYRTAIDTLTRSIELDSLKQAFVTRGKAYQKLNSSEEACTDFRMAMKLGEDNIQDLIIDSCSK